MTPATASRAGSFRVKNNGRAGLVALVTTVNYVNQEGGEMAVLSVGDSWIQDGPFVGPGAEGDIPHSTYMSSKSPITRVTLRPVFALFDDGTSFGLEPETTRECLRVGRVKMQVAMRNALTAYRTRGEAALRNAILAAPKELGWLQLTLQKHGSDGVTAELSKPRMLAP